MATALDYVPSQQWESDPFENNIAKMFEDDNCSEVSSSPSSSSTEDMKVTQPQPSDQFNLIAPPTSNDGQFVNVYMIFDPNQQKFVCPKQVLSYKMGELLSTTVLDPTVINDFASGLFNTSKGIATPNTNDLMPMPSNTPSAFVHTPSPAGIVTPSSASPSPSVVGSTSPFPLPSMSMSNMTLDPTSIPGVLPPLRALSAYNFFFRDERDRILSGGDPEYTSAKQQKMLEEHWSQDRTKKRRHRKSHGKIGFTNLSKLISSRWKELTVTEKNFYRDVAARDFIRLQRENDEFRNSLQGFTGVVG